MNAMIEGGVETGGAQWGEVFSGGVFSFQFSVFRGFATALKTENFDLKTSSLLHERGEVVE
jgi:hypothetical protein